ncbi:hypothetical protein WMY93_022817 [Mugilogobius chulae]|uniref:Methyltransferase type 11 domain-containing protein n=1 Tax=Mugilogobius chulae TaxID=88201 RepID=A0AAW0NIL3_9GOBI
MAVRLFEDKEHAAEYVKLRVTPDEVVRKIVTLLEKRVALPAKLALDVGCGSGQGTVLLAPFFNQVVGTDISPPSWSRPRQCPAEELPFDSGTVDLVTSMTAAHWFDRPRFLEEVNRVLRPGGCLALLTYAMDMELEYGDVSHKLREICFEARRTGSEEDHHVNGFIGLVHTFSAFRKFIETKPQEAEEFSNRIRNKLLDAMQVSSPETEVTMVTKYFYWIACKP